MPWPFTNGTIAPDFQIGPGLEMFAGSPDVLSDASGWLIGAHFQNTSDAEVTLVVTNGEGKELIGPIGIPAGAPYDPPAATAFMPFVGLRAGASGPGVIGHLWGYEDEA